MHPNKHNAEQLLSEEYITEFVEAAKSLSSQEPSKCVCVTQMDRCVRATTKTRMMDSKRVTPLGGLRMLAPPVTTSAVPQSPL